MNNDTNIDENELSKEQILDLADAQGRKFGFLLATSPLDTETKEAFLSIIEKATSEEINAVIDLFEEGLLRAQNTELDNWLKTQMEYIKFESEAKEKEIEQDALNKLSKLEEAL